MIVVIPKTREDQKERRKQINIEIGINMDYIDSLEDFKTQWGNVISDDLGEEIEKELEERRIKNDQLYFELMVIEGELMN